MSQLKGLPATLFGTIPSRAIYFYSYNKSKSFFNYKDSPLVHIVSVSLNYFFPNPKNQSSAGTGIRVPVVSVKRKRPSVPLIPAPSKAQPTLKRYSKALSAGSSQIILTTPIWVVRTKQQLDQTRGYSLFRCARDIYRHNGLQGFWRGMTASLLGLSETVIFFVIYENLKSRYIMQGL